ncbi:MAG: guanylate kinase [Bacillota bacterium]
MVRVGGGNLFVLSGPSGVGKGTVLDKLMENFDDINYSVSATTRKPRTGEVEGEDYFFVSEDEFFRLKEEGEFIETARVHNHYYGTPRQQVRQSLEQGEDIILEIDIQGARQVKEQFPGAIMIFLLPPSLSELEERLQRRGSESDKSRELRLENARQEIKKTVNYDYEVVNDVLEETVEQVKNIILSFKK